MSRVDYAKATVNARQQRLLSRVILALVILEAVGQLFKSDARLGRQ